MGPGAEPIGQAVRLVIERWEQTAPDAAPAHSRHVYSAARWRSQGGAHELVVDEPQGAAPAAEGGVRDRTVYRIDPGPPHSQGDIPSVSITRSGSVVWVHRFAAGESASSVLSVRGAGALDVRTATEHLAVELSDAPASGRVQLRYTLVVGGVAQRVEIRLAYRARGR
ncbi:MAG: DUF1934 family protein [Alicyclobacillus sp.]|nr:DUF1934 family protein [Alicyclobacillus sp.]